jgi:hypothetical protein
MMTREITSAEEFESLNKLIQSMADDYKDMLSCLTGERQNPYSLPFTYSRLLLDKAAFERTVRGLQHTALLLPLYEKLNGQWPYFYVQKEQFRYQLNNFLKTCQIDETLRQKLKEAGDEADANITVEKNCGLLQLNRREEVDSLNIHSALMVIDNLRLALDERKNLGLQFIFNLQRDQKDLELVFTEIERLFWENLPILRRFRSTLKEHREAFLILDDKKYPWWYPEKRKAKAKPSLQAEDKTNSLKSKVA